MGRPRKYPAPVEAPGERGDVSAIKAGVEAFKAKYPDRWDAMKLGPLQHGIEQMIEAME